MRNIELNKTHPCPSPIFGRLAFVFWLLFFCGRPAQARYNSTRFEGQSSQSGRRGIPANFKAADW